jgi:hypothetical protein
LAKGDAIPHDDHVLRHVPGTKIDAGKVQGTAFVRRAGEDGLSIWWRETVGDIPLEDQLKAIRAVIRLGMSSTHRFAELSVGDTREFVKREGAAFLTELQFEHEPLAAEGEYSEDPFHSEIFGSPADGDPRALGVGLLIAECVMTQYAAVVIKAK